MREASLSRFGRSGVSNHIQVIPSVRLEANKYQFLIHWFDLPRVQNRGFGSQNLLEQEWIAELIWPSQFLLNRSNKYSKLSLNRPTIGPTLSGRYRNGYRLVTVRTNCNLEHQAASTMNYYPTQPNYPGTEPTNPCPILMMPSVRLGSNKYQF